MLRNALNPIRSRFQVFKSYFYNLYIIRFMRYVSPHLYLKRENIKQWVLLGTLSFLNFLEIRLRTRYMLELAQKYRLQIEKNITNLENNRTHYHKTLRLVLKALGLIISSRLVSILKYYVQGKLQETVTQLVRTRILKDWVGSRAYFGLYYLEPEPNKVVNSNEIVGRDVLLLGWQFDMLFNGLLNFILNLIESAKGLKKLARMIKQEPSPKNSLLPVLMLGSEFFYEWLIGKFMRKLEERARNQDLEGRPLSYDVEICLHAINHYKEEIEMAGAGYLLEYKIDEGFRKYEQTTSRAEITMQRSSFEAIEGSIKWQFDQLLYHPKLQENVPIIKSYSDLSETVSTFKQAILSLSYLQPDEYKQSFEQIEKFSLQIQNWKQFQFENKKVVQHEYGHSGKDIKFENISLYIKKENGEDYRIQNCNLSLELNKIYLLEGPSGIGKSLFLKSLLGIYPFVKGTFSFPMDRNHILALSQTPYVPQLVTLKEVLGLNLNSTESEINQAHELMGHFGLSDKISDLDNKDFNLSGGEAQRTMLVALILKIMRQANGGNPVLILLDESFNQLDPAIKCHVQQYLKQVLPTKLAPSCPITYIVIDHQSDIGWSSFYDETLMIDREKCKLILSQGLMNELSVNVNRTQEARALTLG